MSYRPIKKDFTEGTVKCFFCNRPLKSLKTYILENIYNNELVNSGPTCAAKNLDKQYNLNIIPDLTKYTLSTQTEDEEELFSNNDNGKRNNSTLTTEDRNLRTAIEYLELRENKLAENFQTSYPTLKNYYTIYQNTRILDSDSVNHILNIEKKAPENYKLRNLQMCYNYSFWLIISIKKLDKEANNFLSPVYEYLKKKMRITEKQKNGINNWLKKLDGIPQLK